MSSAGSSSTNNGRKGDDSGSKTGRKGDPRMHRAVAARLANPDLSLYEALRIGGFDYPNDSDPSYCDHENITLGQRKNQLSRRLRLAKKSDDNVCANDKNADAASEATTDENSTDNGGRHKKRNSSSHKPPVKQVTTNNNAWRSTGESNNLVSGKKRDYETAAGKSLAEQAAEVEAQFNSLKDLESRLAMERSRLRDENCRREDTSALAAKYHPDFHHIIIPRGAGGLAFPNHNQPFTGQLRGPLDGSPKPEMTIQEQLLASGLSGGLSNFALSAASKPHTSMPPPSISNVAIRSLQATAKSVGITLEQLALALSTSKNLVQLLSGITGEDGNDKECQKKKMELSLRLHEYETKTLYSRCMLLGGYGPDDASEGNPTQLRFAMEAWQNEGKRLQRLLRNSGDMVSDDPPLGANLFDHLQKNTATAANNESNQYPHHMSVAQALRGKTSQRHVPSTYSHSHDSEFKGLHIHRLEGKCGHRAILHQPKGGTPHIDFVVGDKVECYGDVEPSPEAPSNQWPSQYRCDELACTAAEQCSKARQKEESHPPAQGNDSKIKKAKVLDLNSVDLTTQEWTVDFNDDVLMSLFRLGDKNSDQTRHNDSSDDKQSLLDMNDDNLSTAESKCTTDLLQDYKL